MDILQVLEQPPQMRVTGRVWKDVSKYGGHRELLLLDEASEQLPKWPMRAVLVRFFLCGTCRPCRKCRLARRAKTSEPREARRSDGPSAGTPRARPSHCEYQACAWIESGVDWQEDDHLAWLHVHIDVLRRRTCSTTLLISSFTERDPGTRLH